MQIKNYQRLSRIYDIDWGKFALRYVELINETIAKRKIERAKILDLACGTGNLAVKLAREGYIVKGMDISREMIQIAQNRAVDLKNISFDVQDMTKFKVETQYDLVTCTFDSINYLLEVVDINTMISNVAYVLRESGLFIFDFNTEQQYLKNHHGSYKKEIDGEVFIQRAFYSPEEKIAITEFEFTDGEIERHLQRPYSLAQIENFLTKSSFKMEEVFAGFNRQPYDQESERLICVAQKTV